jgi:hypothetical protein
VRHAPKTTKKTAEVVVDLSRHTVGLLYALQQSRHTAWSTLLAAVSSQRYQLIIRSMLHAGTAIAERAA